MEKTKNNNNKTYRTVRKWFWGLFAGGIALVILLFVMASMNMFGELPTFEVIENPEASLSTEVISEDGEVIGKIWLSANLSPVKYEELSPYLIDALKATEDERFEKHSGIDFRSTARAFIFLGNKGGASTITQQLAKNLFTDQPAQNKLERGFQKIKEWIIAARLERSYTKDEIITMYFNTFDFLFNSKGIKNASSTYFGKLPSELKIEEAAVLVGMAKNPILYNPIRNPKNALSRRNTVISQMLRNDYITQEEADSLKALPLITDFNPSSHTAGLAQHFREYVREIVPQLLKDVKKPDGTGYSIVKDGLRIYTTLDSRMQKYAEEAVEEHLSNLQKVFDYTQRSNKNRPFINITQKETDRLMTAAMKRSDRYRSLKKQGMSASEIEKDFHTPTQMTVFTWQGEKDTLMTPMDSIRYYKSFLNTGLLSVNPLDGHVKAWVGSINYKNFMFDHVIKSARQVGSTFKPFVYATAIDQLKMSPCDELINDTVFFSAQEWNMPEDWAPKNSDGKYDKQPYTLIKGLAMSLNSITAGIVKELGTTEPIRRLVKNLGVTTEIPEGPSMCLGTADISLYDMVGAYSAFANKGIYTKPILITRIEDKNGVLLYQDATPSRAVLSEESAYVIVKLLEGVTQYGTGGRLRSSWGNYVASDPDKTKYMTGYPYKFDNPIAGKTGTTQNQSDGWFMGMVPNLVTGVWVGCEDRSAHFSTITYGQGATMALPVWGLYMKKIYADPTLEVSRSDFPAPERPLSIPLDCTQSGVVSQSIPTPSSIANDQEIF